MVCIQPACFILVDIYEPGTIWMTDDCIRSKIDAGVLARISRFASIPLSHHLTNGNGRAFPLRDLGFACWVSNPAQVPGTTNNLSSPFFCRTWLCMHLSGEEPRSCQRLEIISIGVWCAMDPGILSQMGLQHCSSTQHNNKINLTV